VRQEAEASLKKLIGRPSGSCIRYVRTRVGGEQARHGGEHALMSMGRTGEVTAVNNKTLLAEFRRTLGLSAARSRGAASVVAAKHFHFRITTRCGIAGLASLGRLIVAAHRSQLRFYQLVVTPKQHLSGVPVACSAGIQVDQALSPVLRV